MSDSQPSKVFLFDGNDPEMKGPTTRLGPPSAISGVKSPGSGGGSFLPWTWPA